MTNLDFPSCPTMELSIFPFLFQSFVFFPFSLLVVVLFIAILNPDYGGLLLVTILGGIALAAGTKHCYWN